MKRQLLSLLWLLGLLLLAPSPAWGLDQKTAYQLAERVGIPQSSITISVRDLESPDPLGANGHFGIFFGMPLVIVEVPQGFPEPAAQRILFHELWHYVQFRDGTIWTLANPWVEWDADVFAINTGCSFGNEAEVLKYWTWIMDIRGAARENTSDEAHGLTYTAREENGRVNAHRCYRGGS